MDDKIQRVAGFLSLADRVTVLTGAGVSKESGVPTFRDAMDGLWAKYDPQELATPQAFKANPKLIWDWYQWRRELVSKAKPNPGHFALAQLERHVNQVYLITQNVDDLHEQAHSTDIIHLHGNIARSKCFQDCKGVPTVIDISTLDFDAEAGPPKCPYCGAYVRPDVVWFGEALPSYAIQTALQHAKNADVMLVVGTSGMVQPAAQLPILAAQSGAIIVEVNPDKTPISQFADVHLKGASGIILPKVIEALKDYASQSSN